MEMTDAYLLVTLAAAVLASYVNHRNKTKRCEAIKTAKEKPIDQLQSLIGKNQPEYVVVRGVISCQDPLTNLDGQPCVWKDKVETEHKARAYPFVSIFSSLWYKTKKEKEKTTQSRPFEILGSKGGKVSVSGFGSALDKLDDPLIKKISQEHRRSGFMMDFLEDIKSGEIVLKTDYDERNVTVGSSITAIGVVSRDGTRLSLVPDGKLADGTSPPSLFSAKSFADLILDAETQVGKSRVILYLTLAVSGAAVAYCIARKVTSVYNNRIQQARLEILRNQRSREKRKRKEQKVRDGGEVKGEKQLSDQDDVESSDGGERDCIICCDKPINCLFMNCGHMYTCMDCASRLSKCPVCNQKYKQLVRVFSN